MQRRTRAIGIVLATFGCLQHAGTLVAQEPATVHADATGPTMQQTIAFIQESFSNSGVFTAGTTSFTEQSLTPASECAAALRQRFAYKESSPPSVILTEGLVDLKRSDPASLEISPRPSKENPSYYVVIVKGLHYTPRAAATAEHRTEELRPGQSDSTSSSTGFLDSIGDGSLSIVTTGGVQVRYTFSGTSVVLAKDANGMIPDFSKPATQLPLSTIATGDLVFVRPGYVSNKHGDPQFKHGSFVDDSTIVITLMRKAVAGRQERSVAAFDDKDTAERVAKAFVHAMILCQPHDKPALF